ncbi:MAG: hypothetical protein A2289_03865 [Deltaproteobacteria bacterium RIFOXYA12_FULL_58_15]|nr:MAG: hypothetical protein A2289_03865 [Deltaproteobacteria bacterium RIFOXYA12_FULL_58_15]OGR08609.1 MAG: hypothetical protein A2341_00070 [Deltaproteobacteria bacterium RIFOXYB12_FULL_58_9]
MAAILFVGLPLLVVPQPVRAEESLPVACRPGSWDLDGAGHLGGEDTTFSPAWQGTLEDLAACLAHPKMRTYCLNVEGRFDQKAFSPELIQVFGSKRGAQEARARARASRVISELLRLGVITSRVKETAPPEETSYRGVHISLVADCVVDENTAIASQEEVKVAVAAAVEAYAQNHPGSFGDPVALRQQLSSLLEEQLRTGSIQPAPMKTRLWVDASLSLNLLAGGLNTVTASVLMVGGGYANDNFYLHLDVGIQAAVQREQRVGIEFSASVGHAFQSLPWLEVGVTAGDRFSYVSFSDPWIEESWFVGVESSQCLLSIWREHDTCLQETIAPLASRNRRGIIENDEMRRISGQRDSVFRFDLAILSRHDFL